jgi:CHAT domain-containing protein
MLEAWEIMQLDLKARLGVLSACETARGEIGAGEGMIGLSWALFVARVPATVVSQWRVEAGPTTSLMFFFHAAMRNKRMSKAQALRAAALELLRIPRYRHPFYWAPFIVVGDWL